MVLSHDANCWTDMVSEDDKRRTRPLWHYTHISDDILPALRKAGVPGERPDLTSLGDVVLSNPGRFAWSYARHVGPTLVNSFGASLVGRHLKPGVPVSGTGLTWWLHVMGYVAYRQAALSGPTQVPHSVVCEQAARVTEPRPTPPLRAEAPAIPRPHQRRRTMLAT